MVENELGKFLDDQEREDTETLGGLVFSIAQRVPIRGELIQHHSGIEFEVLDVDPRRIKRLKIRNDPSSGNVKKDRGSSAEDVSQ